MTQTLDNTDSLSALVITPGFNPHHIKRIKTYLVAVCTLFIKDKSLRETTDSLYKV